MSCCGSSALTTARAPTSQTAPHRNLRVRVESLSDERKYRDKYPDYAVQRIPIGATSALLIFTR